MIKHAVIFDLDGTIVKTEHLWLLAALALLDKRHIEVTQSTKDHLEQLLNGLDVLATSKLLKVYFSLHDSVEDIYEEMSRYAHQLYDSSLALIPGFKEFHAFLQERGIPSALATNSDAQTTALLVKALKLDQYFGEHIYNVEDVNYKAKPRPDLFLHAAKLLKIDPKQCIVIEDSAHGVKAAKAAGMLCIGFNSHGDVSQLQEADMIGNRYEEITKIFKTML